MGYRVADIARLDWEERPPKPGEAARLAADITTQAELQQSRARVWRYPPHTTGRRHRDHVQEEVFVVVSGTLTMLLGDEPERVDLGPGSVVAVDPMTPLQMRNETDEELVCFVYGAPPLREGADSSTTSSYLIRARRRPLGTTAPATPRRARPTTATPSAQA